MSYLCGIISRTNTMMFQENRTVPAIEAQHGHHDCLSVRLSVIISRLLAGESLEFEVLADESGVSERILQRDFQQHLVRLGLGHRSGSYQLICRIGREHLPNTFAFIHNSKISGIIPAQNHKLIRLIASNSDVSLCLIGHGTLSSLVTQTTCFLKLAEAIRNYRAITLLANGKSYKAVAPRRLVFQSKNWLLAATRARNLQVFRVKDANAVTVLDTSFRREPELDALTTSEEFISALFHFRFVSDVIQTFREQQTTFISN